MPLAPSAAQQAASRANGAASSGPATPAGNAPAAMNGTRHGLRGGGFALMPGEDGDELARLERAVAADWRPRDAYERHWSGELVAAMWRQQRLRRLEFAALAAADAEAVPSEASLQRLLTLARYGARIDKDSGRALAALRSLNGRGPADLADEPACTDEPEPIAATAASRPAGCTGEPETATSPALSPAARTREPERQPAAPLPRNPYERRRCQALARVAGRQAA